MAKTKSHYVCTECGGQSPKWQGQCPHCGVWNTLVETLATTARYSSSTSQESVIKLPQVKAQKTIRYSSGLSEFDRVLGGGLVPGAVILLGGDPGIGKSTLLLQALAVLAPTHTVLYVSGEESVEQIALRAQRLDLQHAPLPLLAEIQIEKIMEHIQKARPQLVVIDSIQTMYSEALQSAPGSVAQVRESAARLTRLAKEKAITTILVGHVTKEGAIAGPRVLEHIVDVVLYFEGESHSSYRLIRAIKNRFGGVNELSVFAMTEAGLKGVANPSALFLSTDRETTPGSSVLAALEGTRPLLVEIQALVDSSPAQMPRRLAVGLDAQRLAMLLAVLHRHGGVNCAHHDVFVNAVGGLRISEPAADLAVLLSINSSFINTAIDDKLIVFGEVGLGGEIRPVQRGQERLKEAAKLGFARALIPNLNKPKQVIAGIEVTAIKRLSDAIAYCR